jgi:NodT family efflux transporter outer membrane factor (OMF) lipoprotein
MMNMKYTNIIAVAALSLMLASCGIYNKYESKGTVPDNVFGAEVTVDKSGSVAQLSWREFFTDPVLQSLIESALEQNTNLNSARIAVEKSEASLKSARLAYLPSFNFAPSGNVASFNNSAAAWTYSLPLQMTWDPGLFGSNTTKKRKAEAVLMEARMQEENVRTNLISTVAQQYFMLQILDRQLDILIQTDSLWNRSLETQRVLWENGKAYSTAVDQMESSYLNAKTQIVDVRRNILSVENAICKLLAIPPQHIERSKWGNWELPERVDLGVPAELLQYRPDIRMADYAMAEAFYNTQSARQAFYPNLSLSGILGWTNNAGSTIVNPGALLLNAGLSLMQPIINRGQLKANKKVAELTEEDMKQMYVQTVINAGNQVNEALADCQAARDKHEYYHRQVEVLQSAYVGTHELMDSGKASYIEVLTAQERLLSAQLNEAMNMYKGALGVVALYISLGGGTK